MLPVATASATRTLRLASVAVVSGAVALTGYVAWRRAVALDADKQTRQAQVQMGTAVFVARAREAPPGRTVTLPGELRPFRVTTVYAKVSGYLKAIYVDKGDRVRAGQQLGLVESPETDQQMLSKQADLVMKRQVNDRYKSLVGRGVVSAQEMDRAAAALESGTAELERLRALKGYEVIRAPFDGVVTARYADPGALMPAATGATQSAQPLVEVQDMQKVRIFVYVAQAEAPYIRDGDAVHVQSQDDAAINFDARITRTTHALDLRTRTMLVEIDVDNADGHLYPGLFVNVTLQVHSPAMLTVPSDAVFLRDGKMLVARIESGHAAYTQVEVASDDGHMVHISHGLRAGDMVGLHIADAVSNGATVRPFEAKTKPD